MKGRRRKPGPRPGGWEVRRKEPHYVATAILHWTVRGRNALAQAERAILTLDPAEMEYKPIVFVTPIPGKKHPPSM
jgi:hypothetical protein